ncbi:hypothetical protein GA0004734_00032010 [Rhizobium sp. 9140]|nr:hypothetical protein GA0004734_00032010 [Rhizobium sp. 9140]
MYPPCIGPVVPIVVVVVIAVIRQMLARLFDPPRILARHAATVKATCPDTSYQMPRDNPFRIHVQTGG